MMNISEENLVKLEAYSKVLFEQSKDDPDYPFDDWEEQMEECKELFDRGDLTQKFLDFAVV